MNEDDEFEYDINIEDNEEDEPKEDPKKPFEDNIEPKIENKIQRVIWNPRLRPDPLQFFLNEKYSENLAKKKSPRLSSFSNGFVELELDLSKMDQFQFGISRAIGVLPDGTPFDIPDVDPVPNFITMTTELFAKSDDLRIYLALPLNQNESSFEHYFSSDRFRKDEIDFDGKKQPIAFNKFILITDNINVQNYNCLPILHFKIDRNTLDMVAQKKFIPPMLNILNNEQGKKSIKTLQDKIESKIHTIWDRYISLNRSKNNNVSANVIDALVFQLLNRFDGYFKNVLKKGFLQPYEFYQKFITMTAELATYASKSKLNIAHLPYNHENFALNIDDIFTTFNKQLNFYLKYEALKVELQRNENGTFNTEFIPSHEFENVDCIVAIYSTVDKQDVLNHLPNQSKISSPSRIDFHIRTRSAGVRLEHIEELPDCVPYFYGFVYFKMTHTIASKEAWDDIYAECAISFHFMGLYSSLDAALWLVKKNRQ